MDDQITTAVLPAKGLQVKAEHKAEWVRRFHQSGLGYEKFSRLHGLRMATLWRWVQKERELRSEGGAVAFTEIKLAELASQQRSGLIELSFANGNTLRIWGEVPASMLEQLLRLC
jgi:transposase-like protein